MEECNYEKVYGTAAGSGHGAEHGRLRRIFRSCCHRGSQGYAEALSTFDAWLGDFLPRLGQEDVVLITADHGCDPAYTATTDHTREYVPLLILGKAVKPGNLGTRASFADIAATVTELLGVDYETPGRSFAGEII